MISFREFAKTKNCHLTKDEEIYGELLIKFILSNSGLTKFFSRLGTGTTTTLELVESYFKWEEYNRGKENG